MNVNTYHVPVLLDESVFGLNVKKDGIYVDVTFGGGGHSRKILYEIHKVNNDNDKGHLFSFDQDADAEENILSDSRFTFVRSNFRYIKNFLRYYGVEDVDGIIADLGVSSHHFDEEDRGFSFRFNGKLDMRMNQRHGRTAADIVNVYSECDLANMFYQYGELNNSRQLANKIVKARQSKRIELIEDLLDVLQIQDKQTLAKIFQALRIEVNHELEALEEMLYAATEILKPGGRLVVISYHSLEDRMVKNIMRSGNVDGQINKDIYGRIDSTYKLINRKVISPSDKEQALNPRSRSAKLRIAEKL